VAYYDAGQRDVKLASVTNKLFDEPWRATKTRRVLLRHDGQSFTARETLLEGPQTSLVVWDWYYVDGTFTGNDYMAKLLLARARLFRSRRISAAIAAAVEYSPQTDPVAVLNDFLAHTRLAPNLEASSSLQFAPGDTARLMSP
jgi:EpsI family protein